MNVLNITDGTTTVNLLNLADGFSVSDWIQAVAQYKGGGVWQQSALTDESRLVARAFDNVAEEIPIPAVGGGGEDAAIAGLATLLVLLEKAASYWVDDWRDEPVWLESQTDCETNKMYASVYVGGFPDMGDPYSHAYLMESVLAGLTLRVVRGHWMDNPPTVGTALPISAVETWDGRNLGNVDTAGTRVPTTAAEVYVVNKQLEANITHVYHCDVGAPDVWVGNLMDVAAGAFPYGLFPAGVANGDFLVIGIECAGPPYYPFSNVIFNIGTANVNIDTIWEFWDGAAPWGALSPTTDNTDATGDAFTQTGVNGVWWEPLSTWVIGNLNAIFGAPAPNVDGYWIRCRCTGLGGAATVPTQALRDIYSCIWPYVEVQADDIGGHIDAILKLTTECRSQGADSLYGKTPNRILAGLWSVDRGEDFTAFINLGNAQNSAGVTTIPHGGDTTVQGAEAYPAYYYMRFAPAGNVALTEQVEISIRNSSYNGTFRIFVRAIQIGGSAGDIGVAVEHKTGGVSNFSETKYTSYTSPGQGELFDFGTITLPGPVPFELDIEREIRIWCSNSNAPAADLYLTELVLIPVDEFAFDVWTDAQGAHTRVEFPVYVDSITDPKRLGRSLVYDERVAYDEVDSFWQSVLGDRLRFHPGQRQRYYFLSTGISLGNELSYSCPWNGFRNQMWAVQRYLGRRGAG